VANAKQKAHHIKNPAITVTFRTRASTHAWLL
jgi:hypothetical protein